MYQCIKKFCENKDKNGLFLMNMPTGFGKTYSVLNYIYDSVMDENNHNKKYIFITTLKKNLPIEDLENRFKINGYERKFKEKFLFIDNNADSVIDGFKNIKENSIPNEIKRLDEYSNCYLIVDLLKKQNNITNDKIIKDTFAKNEREFRKKIKELLSKEFKTSSDKMNAILYNKKWKWITEIYPVSLFFQKQIIFMSMDKFLRTIDTIIDKPISLYNNAYLDNAILFIDEIDATKDTILNYIIDSSMKNKINYIELFNTIYNYLSNHSISNELLIESQSRANNGYTKSLKKVVNDVIKKAKDLNEKYSLQFSHKTEINENEQSKNFLFQNHRYMTILRENKNYIVVKTDRKTNKNVISFSKDKPNKNEVSIQKLLRDLTSFITWFKGAVYILASNYSQLKNENAVNGEEQFLLEEAIKTVLSEFGIKSKDETYQRYITELILTGNKRKNDNLPDDLDLSFYNKGFRYYSFEDSRNHDQESNVLMASYNLTPEKILLSVCNHAKVVGVSATATIPTVTGNFDLKYLKLKLGDKFHKISHEDYIRLSNEFAEQQNGYEAIQIHINQVDSSGYNSNIWKNIFNDDELSEYVYNYIQDETSNDSNNYNRERYYRIAYAFKEYVVHKDIHSFLCILTAYPNNSSMKESVLENLFNLIRNYNNVNKVESEIFILKGTGQQFEDKKNEMIRILSQSKRNRLFVISVYQAIGAGQNLQYRIPNDLRDEIVKVGTYEPRNEKDFDAIYLEKPTNLLVNLGNNSNEEAEIVKSIFQKEYLQENGEISQNKARESIKNAFNVLATQVAKGDGIGYDTKSCHLHALRTVIQCIGRNCRTNMKNSNIYIYAHSDIRDILNLNDLNDSIFNTEFVRFAEYFNLNSKSATDNKDDILQNLADLTSKRSNNRIRRLLNDEWTIETLAKWRKIRYIVMKYPTMSVDEYNEFSISHYLYFELPEERNYVYYSQDDDYENVTISFDGNEQCKNILSETMCRLDSLMRFPELKQYFESQGFATTFKKNKYIMTPIMWNNIYKGALGEYSGEFLFEKYIGYKLEEITEPEFFELFDFKVPNKSVYVDFKNWSDNTDFDDKEILEKIRDKASTTNAKMVIIANIISSGHHEIKEVNFGDKGLKIVKCQSLLKDENGKITLNTETCMKLRRYIDAIRDDKSCN